MTLEITKWPLKATMAIEVKENYISRELPYAAILMKNEKKLHSSTEKKPNHLFGKCCIRYSMV